MSKKQTLKTHSIKSAANPVGNLFNPKDLPHDLTRDIDIEKDIQPSAVINPKEVLLSWISHRYPTLMEKQDCQNVITMQSDHNDQVDLYFGGKLALIAYSLPYFLQPISTHFHMKNSQFVKYIETFVAESTFLAYRNMDKILEKQTNTIQLPPSAQISGFFIRTPIQIWNERKQRVYKIPTWEHRMQLLNYLVCGNVNVYVFRQNLETGFECYVLFRGTSNEFNGIPQYGKNMANTQLYRIPQYDPIENKFYEQGSDSTPLFHHVYIDMVQNALPHILQSLEWLNVWQAERVVFAGHSMGAAMVLSACFLLKHRQPKLWDKSFFRSYAAPMCCNDAAVLQIEQWIIDSMQPNKFFEVVNTDDFVNVQYLLGGKKGLQHSIQAGTTRIGSWLLQEYFSDPQVQTELAQNENQNSEKVQRMLRIIQLYPEIALSTFLSGAMNSQIESLPEQNSAGFRLGVRREEAKLWGSEALKSTYNNTLKVFFCQRRILSQTEYLGKSHSNYVDLNLNVFWSPTRMFEDNLYRYYSKHSLKHNNQLCIVGLFPERDMEKANKLLKSYRTTRGEYQPAVLSILSDYLHYHNKKAKPSRVNK